MALFRRAAMLSNPLHLPTMLSLVSTTLIHRVDGLLTTEVDGETVLMDAERGHYYGLARSAQRIWEMLEQPMSFQDLCNGLAAQYKGAAEQIESDTRRFVQQMAEESLVHLR